MTQVEPTIVNVNKSQILADLNAGLTRKEIYAKYNMSIAVGKSMIASFKLINAKKKGKAGVSFNFIDDTDQAVGAAAEAAVASIEASADSEDLIY